MREYNVSRHWPASLQRGRVARFEFADGDRGAEGSCREGEVERACFLGQHPEALDDAAGGRMARDRLGQIAFTHRLKIP